MAEQNIIELIIRLRDEMSTGLSGIQSGLERFHSAIGGGQGILSEYTKSLLGVAAAYLSFQGVKSLGQSLLEVATSAKGAELQFSVLLGSVDQAKLAFSELNEAAQKSPFAFEQVREAAKSFALMGLDLQQWTKPALDLAAAGGFDVAQSFEAIARAASLGAPAVRQLRQYGLVPLIQSFSEAKFGITELTDLTLPQFQQALLAALTDPNGRIAGAAEKMADSWKGGMARLSEVWHDFRESVMDLGVFDKLKEMISGLRAKIEEWATSGQLAAWANMTSQAIQWIIDKAVALGTWIANHPTTVKLVTEAYIGWKLVLVDLLGIAIKVIAQMRLLAAIRVAGAGAGVVGAAAGGAAAGAAGGAAATAGGIGLLGGLAIAGGALALGGLAYGAYDYFSGNMHNRAEAAVAKEEAAARVAAEKQADAEIALERAKLSREQQRIDKEAAAAAKELAQARAEQLKDLEKKWPKAVEAYRKAIEALGKAEDDAAQKAINLHGQLTEALSKATGNVGAAVGDKLLNLGKTVNDQINAGIDPETALASYRQALTELRGEIAKTAAEQQAAWEKGTSGLLADAREAEKQAAEAWATFYEKGDDASQKVATDALAKLDAARKALNSFNEAAAGDNARIANDALAKIDAAYQQADSDLQQSTTNTAVAVQSAWNGALGTIKSRLEEIGNMVVRPLIEARDYASDTLDSITEKIVALQAMSGVEVTVNVRQMTLLPENFALSQGNDSGFFDAQSVYESHAAGGWLTRPTVLVDARTGKAYGTAVERGEPELITPASKVGRGSAGGDVNIYITQPVDRSVVRNVIIPEIKRAQGRA